MPLNQHLERLNGLAGFLATPVMELLTRSERELGRPLLVVRGWASYREQLEIYMKGRTLSDTDGVAVVTDPRLVVTNAKPGASGHNVIAIATQAAASVAVDVIPFKPDGTPDWAVARSFWAALWVIGWDVGLDPLGDRQGAYLQGDLGHFEEPNWKMKLAGLGLRLPIDQTARPAAPSV